MGKMKVRRQKYHTKSARVNARKEDEIGKTAGMTHMETNELQDVDKHDSASLAAGGVFKDLNIDLKNISAKLPDFDAQSAITSKTFKGANLTKKEKQQIKREVWKKKVDTILSARNEEKNRQKRKKTAIVGDMQPLADTLPTLELLMKQTKSSKLNEAKPKSLKKTKQRQKAMLNDISVFQQVLKHPVYLKDPLSTISEHLQNKMKAEKS